MTEEGTGPDTQQKIDALVRQLRAKIVDNDKDVADLKAELATAHAEKALKGRTANAKLLTPYVAGLLAVARDKGGKFVAHVRDKDGTARLTEQSNSVAAMGVDELVAELREGQLAEYFRGETTATETSTTGTTDTGRRQTTAPSSGFQISEKDAQDPVKYRRVRKQAMEADETVQIVD